METHQKDIQEKDPFGQNRRAEDEADDEDDEDDDDDDEKSFLKALLAELALKNVTLKCKYHDKNWEFTRKNTEQES